MHVTDNLDYSWKIAVGGAGAVGKTTFLLRYLTQKFISTTAMTVGVQFHSHALEHHGKHIGMLFWDLGGQERFRFMHSSYMKGSVAALLFFDIARINTVFELAPWIQLIRTYAIPNAPILLVGTKTDVIDESMRAFAVAEGNRIIEEHGLESLVLTSSKTGENIHAAIERLVDILLGNIPRCYAFEDMRAVPPVEKVMTTDPPRFDVYKRTKPVEATSASAMNFVPAIDQLESRRHGRISWGQGRKKNDML